MRADSNVGAWLRELQSQNVASREHEHTPLYEIQRWAGVRAAAASSTRYWCSRNYPVDEKLREGATQALRFSSVVSITTRTHYPLTIVVTEDFGLSLRFSARRSSFGDATLAELATRMRSLLEVLAADGQQRLGTVTWPVERTRVAADSELRRFAVEPLHHLIERQAARVPEKTALILGDREVSYAELNRRANKLAHRLIAEGARPNRASVLRWSARWISL